MSSIDNIGKIALQCGLGMKVLELRILSSTIREDLFTKLFASTCKIIVRGDLCNKGYRQGSISLTDTPERAIFHGMFF